MGHGLEALQVKSDDAPNQAFHFLARRLVAQWANKLDPDWIVRQRDVANLSPEEAARWANQKREIGYIARSLRKAFETDDERERDWFLTWARCLNARATAPFGLGRMKGVIPIPSDSGMERAIFHVQKHIAHTMAMCEARCANPCFFRRKPKQKYCGKGCRWKANKESKLRWWTKNGRN
jgi:hypothetical protein